jgi:dienelactone hydrolase
MSTSPRSTCRWSSVTRSAAALGLIVVGALLAALLAAQPPQKPREVPSFLDEFKGAKTTGPRELPLFLDEFRASTDPPLDARDVEIPSALGVLRGFWVRPEGSQPLPAVILVCDEDPLTAWMQTNARHLASIGYAVLAVSLQPRRLETARAESNEPVLAELSAAVRWVRGRAEVTPNRLGAVGWGWTGSHVLAIAGAMAMQACVVCDAPLPTEPELVLGLRGTAVLLVYGASDRRSEHEGPAFARRLGARQGECKLHVAPKAAAGFLGPPERKTYNHDAAEDAWVAIYNFLEKHVEDARPSTSATRPAKSALTIADMMRSVNEPTGVRGALSRALEKQPESARQWGQVRAHAALIAEAGTWLQTQPPPKGPAGHWQEQALAFTEAASAIVDAADRRDYAAAQLRLVQLAGKCAACHEEHR